MNYGIAQKGLSGILLNLSEEGVKDVKKLGVKLFPLASPDHAAKMSGTTIGDACPQLASLKA